MREILSKEVVINPETKRTLGDIDMSFEILRECSLNSLFPSKSALVQLGEVNATLPAQSRLLLELTASRGETILSRHDGKESKLMKKVKFFNYLLRKRSDLLECNDFVLIVYNGNDPTTVCQEFTLLKPEFKGGVVHFSRNKMISWAAEEREREAEEREREAEEREREAIRAKVAAEEREREAIRAKVAAVEREREAIRAKEAAEELVRQLESRIKELSP